MKPHNAIYDVTEKDLVAIRWYRLKCEAAQRIAEHKVKPVYGFHYRLWQFANFLDCLPSAPWSFGGADMLSSAIKGYLFN